MRKVFVMALSALALLAFLSAPAFAQCPASAGKDAKTAQSASTDTKEINVQNVNDLAYHCSTPCEGHGDYKGKCAMVDMSIKGMTCGGCETTIKTALENTPGVLKVESISYKDGLAHVCFDPDKVNLDNMTKVVVDKGYEAQIIPAVAKTSEVKDEVKPATATGCNLPCPSKASCASKCTGTKKTGDDGTK